MPGYERSRIVGISEDDLGEFICGICLEVLIKPTFTECCGETYCYECISGRLSENNTCPNDRTRLSMDRLKNSPKMVNNLLGNMRIKCEFQENGCQSVVKISDLGIHIESECLFNPSRKCEKCGLAQSGHTDKLCNDILFKNLNELSIKLENVQRAYDELVKTQETDQIKTDSYIGELLTKIENLETALEKENKKPVNQNNPKNEELIHKIFVRGLISSKVAQTMKSIDRANYCLTNPYIYGPQPIGFGADITAFQLHGRMLESVKDKLVYGAKALDVGSGSGYITACMAYMVGPNGKVVGIDKVKEVVDISIENIKKDFPTFIATGRIQMFVGDGRKGVPSKGPYDVIHVGAASATLPQKLIDQLKPGGRLIVPIGNDRLFQSLEQIDKMPNGVIRRERLLKVFVSTFLTD